MSTQTIIAHIDMNSYFATCEQQDNPSWRGKPLGVCEHLGGIIIAASIEAKKLGIKTGTPVWEARKIYPKIILTPTTPDRYRFYTQRFLKVFGDYTDKMEKYSIDEAFLDLTKACNIQVFDKDQLVWVDPFFEAERVVREIKQRMKREVGDYITCSAGIADNKLLAKIASDLQKPDGLVVVRPENKHELYDKLKLTDIPGIAHRQERNLAALGIHTLAQLRDYPLGHLVRRFGIVGYHLHQMGQLSGSWKEGFEEEETIKSMGHMYTLPRQYRRPESFAPVLYKLSEMVGARLRINGLMGHVLHVHVHVGSDPCFGQSKKLDYYLSDGRDIFLEAMAVVAARGGLKNEIKLIGVTVAGLSAQVAQPSLFPFEEKKRRAVAALDEINEKYGDFTAARVPAFLARDIIRDSVGFGRMKEFKNLGGFKQK